jgi:hypothetical protein
MNYICIAFAFTAVPFIINHYRRSPGRGCDLALRAVAVA